MNIYNPIIVDLYKRNTSDLYIVLWSGVIYGFSADRYPKIEYIKNHLDINRTASKKKQYINSGKISYCD